MIHIHIVAPEPVCAVRVAGERHNLRMGDDRVPRFHERFGCHFPIGGNFLRHPDNGGAFLMLPPLEMVGEGGQKLEQAWSTFLFAEENIAAPAVNLCLGQCHVFGLQMRKIPLAGHVRKTAVLLPGETVEGALKLISMAVFGAQLATTVEADVVEGANRAVLLTRDQPRAPRILEHNIVPGFGQILFACSKLPDVGPHLVAFEFGEVFASVARGIEWLRAEIGIAFLGEDIGSRPRIRVHQIFPAGSGATGHAAACFGINVGHNILYFYRVYALCLATSCAQVTPRIA